MRIPYWQGWWGRILALLFAIPWSWFVWREREGGVGLWVARPFGLGILVLAVISGETLVDPDTRQVQRIWKAFGIIPIRSRKFSFDGFREVLWKRQWNEADADSNHSVALVLQNGRTLILTAVISHKPDRSCPDANALAIEVADCLGKPMRVEPAAGKPESA